MDQLKALLRSKRTNAMAAKKSSVIVSNNFERIGETGFDERKRVSLTKVVDHLAGLLRQFSEEEASELRFIVYANDAGQVLLSPKIGVPLHEAWLYKNPEALASVRRGLQQAAEGKVCELKSFEKHADDEID